MKKLIVDTSDARQIRDAKGEFKLHRTLKKAEFMPDDKKAVVSFPKGTKFWVAEPMVWIRDEAGKNHLHVYSVDPCPEGWVRYTVPNAGTRTYEGEARHYVEVVSIKAVHSDRYSKFFWVEVIFKRVEK